MDTIGYKTKRCNKCATIYYPATSFFHKNMNSNDYLSNRCKKCKAMYDKHYRFKNKEYAKQYYLKNKAKIKKYDQNYYIENKKRIKERDRIYKINNSDTQNKRKKEFAGMDVTYTTLKVIDKYEQIREHPKIAGIGQIKCTYCGKWTTPTFLEYSNRKREILYGTGGCLIYCSTECKISCPTYGKHNYPKEFKVATSREVNPLIRQICFEYDDYTCQRCNKKTDIQLHCHHIIGATKYPMLANDIDNVITLCKDCHKQVHKQDGCSYNNYRRKQCA